MTPEGVLSAELYGKSHVAVGWLPGVTGVWPKCRLQNHPGACSGSVLPRGGGLW